MLADGVWRGECYLKYKKSPRPVEEPEARMFVLGFCDLRQLGGGLPCRGIVEFSEGRCRDIGEDIRIKRSEAQSIGHGELVLVAYAAGRDLKDHVVFRIAALLRVGGLHFEAAPEAAASEIICVRYECVLCAAERNAKKGRTGKTDAS